jgi:hypothetical protein
MLCFPFYVNTGCNERVWVGNYTIANYKDLIALSSYKAVTGKLIIISDNLKTLNGLRYLSSVGEDLEIVDNAALTDLNGLNNVQLDGDYLTITNNLELLTSDAEALDTQLRSNGFRGTTEITGNN